MNTSVVPGYPPRPARKFTKAELVQMKAKAMSDPKALAIFGFLNTYLEDCENQLVQVMVHNNIWTGTPPAPVSSGDLEFGLLDYWLNNPGDNTVLQDLQEAWKWVVGPLPTSLFTGNNNYEKLINTVGPGGPGIVASDGTLIGSAKMDALLDPGWLLAPIEYLYHFAMKSYSPFPQVPPPPITLTGASSSQVTIALVGDWGTGNYPTGPAATVIQSIAALKPDYIIHLGDVYYTGLADEEQNNLLGLWAPGYTGKSLTLNSNHEMYDGAFGYFGTALAKNPMFSLQKQSSYFVLQYGNPQQSGGPWSIIGLDSAYWSTSPFIMVGSIQESSSSAPGANAQPKFLQGLVANGLSPKNAIVLTHHNPLSTDGSTMVTDSLGNHLWAQVTTALSGAPAAWYWGHVHNGIVYPNPTATGDSFYGRCVGHGAIPMGNAWGLEAAPASQVQCYANAPSSGVPLRVMNGFALLTITTTGQVTETFYQQDGHPAIWAKPNPFTYQLG